MNGIFIISAPHNMGADIFFVQLSSLFMEIWQKNDFSVMAVSLKMARSFSDCSSRIVNLAQFPSCSLGSCQSKTVEIFTPK